MDQKSKLFYSVAAVNLTAAGLAGLAVNQFNFWIGIMTGLGALIILPLLFLETS